MPLSLVVPPAAPTVTLEQARAHLKVDGTEEDALITDLVQAATRRVEFECSLALITQRWRYFRDCWPRSGVLEIPIHPVRSVISVKALTPSGLITVDPAYYEVDMASRPARLRASPGFPPLAEGFNVVEVLLEAGFGDAPDDVPADLRQAILLLTAFWFENREGSGAADSGGIPAEAARILGSWRGRGL